MAELVGVDLLLRLSEDKWNRLGNRLRMESITSNRFLASMARTWAADSMFLRIISDQGIN